MMFNHTTIDPPAAGTSEFDAWVTAIGHELAVHGPRPLHRHLKALAAEARQSRVAAVSASVLTDAQQNDVARARAFARVVAAIANKPATQPAPLSRTA